MEIPGNATSQAFGREPREAWTQRSARHHPVRFVLVYLRVCWCDCHGLRGRHCDCRETNVSQSSLCSWLSISVSNYYPGREQMSYDENGFGTQDFTDPNNPSIIEPTGRWFLVLASVVIMLAVGTWLYGVLTNGSEQVQQAENPAEYQNPIKPWVPQSHETCSLMDDICQPGVGHSTPIPADPVRPAPTLPPPDSMECIPPSVVGTIPLTPSPSQTIPSPSVAPG